MVTKYQIEKVKAALSEELKVCDESKVLFLSELKAVVEAMAEICYEAIDEEENKKASAVTEARQKNFCLDHEGLKNEILFAISEAVRECCDRYNNIIYTVMGSFGKNQSLHVSVESKGKRKKLFGVTVEFSSPNKN